MVPTHARDLNPGDTIRLRDDLHSKIISIASDPLQLVVGGAFNKTATALKIETEVATISVHPGQLVGRVTAG